MPSPKYTPAMCGRYTTSTPWRRSADHFGLRVTDVPALFQQRWNIAPSQSVLAVGPDREGHPAPAFFRWGLVPARAHDDKEGPINARAETVATKATLAEAQRKRRCLIVADGFHEWKKLQGGKQPWYLRLEGGEPFAFAGIWEAWQPPDGGRPLLTCALLTVPPNDVVKSVHNRMPAILTPADYAAWTNRATDDPDEILSLVRPYEGAMTATPVSNYVNDARQEGEQCVGAPA